MALYPTLVWIHLLLFVFWLGADLGVFILGQHFRRRDYSLAERLTILKLLVITDMGPRTAWALMVPVTLWLLKAGGHWDVPTWLLVGGSLLGFVWLALVWDAHNHDQTRRAKRDRAVESWLKFAITGFYLTLGIKSLATGLPLAETWLAWKAVLFGVIFLAAIMIDVAFRPVGPLLGRLITDGSSDATEVPLRAVMDRTRIWVFTVYGLLLVTSYLGTVKPF